jgi:cephalosporin hydroxylase
MSLQELWQKKGYHYYPTDKGKEHSYLDVYTELFWPLKDQKINIIELGIYLGGSIRLFEEWFTQATVIGYDITFDYIQVPFKSKKILKNCMDFSLDEFKDNPPHIIIDDADHIVEHQLKTVELCYPQLQEGGMLIIEDIQDIMHNKAKFDALGIPYKLYDLRLNKSRNDDILIVYTK